MNPQGDGPGPGADAPVRPARRKLRALAGHYVADRLDKHGDRRSFVYGTESQHQPQRLASLGVRALTDYKWFHAAARWSPIG